MADICGPNLAALQSGVGATTDAINTKTDGESPSTVLRKLITPECTYRFGKTIDHDYGVCSKVFLCKVIQLIFGKHSSTSVLHCMDPGFDSGSMLNSVLHF